MITPGRILKLSFVLIVLVATTGHAQVPTGPILWLRADTGVEVTPTGISVWHDQSGLHHDAYQSDTNRRPTPLATGISGLPTIHFGGNAFFYAPAIFPKDRDYSVAGVIRIPDTSIMSNVLSGNAHAIWFDGTRYLRVHHWVFELDAIASAPVLRTGSCFTITYDAALSTAKLYIDGRCSDSLWTLNNDDSALYVGAFQQGFCMNGDISELFLYDRVLSSSEAVEMNNYLESKYALAVRPAPPPADTTFTSIPARLQFFPRDSYDSATIQIAGKLFVPGFDSVYVQIYRNGVLIREEDHAVQYLQNGAPFSFQTAIHAELSEYTIRVGVRRNGYDSVLTIRDSLVCGDAYLLAGQSNALRGFDYQDSLTEFCRTFGITSNHNAKDTLWTLARSLGLGYTNCISAWSYQFSQLIIDSFHIPVCVIDGGTPGGYIEFNLRNDADPVDVNTTYGRMLYRVQKSHLDHAVKAMIWDQGEWNTDLNYETNFSALRQAWLEDFPSLQKIYVIQMRPNDCAFPSAQRKLMEIERRFSILLPHVTAFASSAIPEFNGCHFSSSGYRAWGTQLYRLLARDFYHGADTIDIASPNIREAYYTSSRHDSIRLLFDPPTTHLTMTSDTVLSGRLRSMHDYFYLDSTFGQVSSVRAEGNALILGVTNPSAHTIAYLPDDVYPEDSLVYEGPWIVTERGVGALGFCDVPISSEQAVINTAQHSLSIRSIENPTHGRLSLLVSGTGSGLLAIYDDLGRSLVETRLELNDNQPVAFSTDLPEGTSGAYFCRIIDSSGTAKTLLVSCED